MPLGFITSVILARLMGPEAFGQQYRHSGLYWRFQQALRLISNA